MNILILKRAASLSLILGAITAIIALVPFFIMYVVLFLSFLCAPAVIIYMKKKNLLGILDMQQSAVFGGAVGFVTSVGFFAVFIPAVLVIHSIFKNYYAYGLQYFITFNALWLFIIILITLAGLLALTNAVTAMGVNAVYMQFEKVPEGVDEPVDITIDEGI